MEPRILVDKLLDLSKNHARTIAEQWYKALVTNPRTISFRKLSRDELISMVESFYFHLKDLYFVENPYPQVQKYFETTEYIEYTHGNGIPLHENIYALIMMRRQIWLYADSQAVFNTSLDMWQGVQSINRTLLLFDYAIINLAQKYAELEAPKPVTLGKHN